MATINGSTNNSQWTFKLEATETATSILNKTSTVKIQVYLGRASSQSYLGGNYNLSVKCADQTQNATGNIPYPTYINGGSWYLLKTFTFTVPNTGNPTTISISSSMSSSDFTPSSASANGTFELTKLHDAPMLSNVVFTELNQQLINLNVGDDYFVTNLSIKNIQIDATTSDDATITKYEILNGDKIYESTTNVVQMNLQQNFLETFFEKNLNREVAKLTIRLTDSLGGVSTTAYPYNYIIPYTKPSIEKTSTAIKRKTGNGTVLTDNIAVLNFVGTCYKGNDVIGNANKPTVQYKIWNTSEPSYSTLTAPNVANVSIKNYEISNILYTSTYNYKIKIYDVFTTTETTINLKVDKVPTGVSVWTEYKDRVDFLRLTMNNNDIIEHGENENGFYIKYYNGILICQGARTFDINIDKAWGSVYESTNTYDFGKFPMNFINTPDGVYLTQKTGLTCFSEKIQNTTKENIGSTWFYRPTTMSGEVKWTFLAIGKWK